MSTGEIPKDQEREQVVQEMFDALKFFVGLYDSDPNTWPEEDFEALRLATEALRKAREVLR
jgi:hypothetical protein